MFLFKKKVKFPFLDGDVLRSSSSNVYITKIIRFARICSNENDFNNRHQFTIAKSLKLGYRYHKLRIRRIFAKKAYIIRQENLIKVQFYLD